MLNFIFLIVEHNFLLIKYNLDTQKLRGFIQEIQDCKIYCGKKYKKVVKCHAI